jgi:hypothetical protein
MVFCRDLQQDVFVSAQNIHISSLSPVLYYGFFVPSVLHWCFVILKFEDSDLTFELNGG